MISNKDIQEICELIKKEYKPKKVILFGSHARGEAKENSDLDLLIISNSEKEKPRWKRGLRLRVLLSKYTFPKDLLFYTDDEVRAWLGVPMSFVNTVFKEGKVLYEYK